VVIPSSINSDSLDLCGTLKKKKPRLPQWDTPCGVPLSRGVSQNIVAKKEHIFDEKKAHFRHYLGTKLLILQIVRENN